MCSLQTYLLSTKTLAVHWRTLTSIELHCMCSENDAPTGTLVGASVGHADVEHYQAIITG